MGYVSFEALDVHVPVSKYLVRPSIASKTNTSDLQLALNPLLDKVISIRYQV
jgi:hypothetical protein